MKTKIVHVKDVQEISFPFDTHFITYYSLSKIASLSLLYDDVVACNLHENRNKKWLELITCPQFNQSKHVRLRYIKVFRLLFRDDLSTELIDYYGQTISTNIRKKCLDSQKPLLVFVNPFSGPGNALKIFNEITYPIFAKAELPVELVITDRAGQAAETVNKLQLCNYSGIVIVSGDGLVYEVFNGLARRSDADEAFNLPIGVIPCGSGNALAAECCFPYGTICKADFSLDASLVVAKPAVRKMRLVRVQTAHHNLLSFLGVAWGFVADLDIGSEKFRRVLGPARFSVGALLQLLQLRRYRGRVSFRPCAESDDAASGWDEAQMPRLDAPVPGDWRTIDGEFRLVYAVSMGRLAAGTAWLPRSRCFHDRRLFLTLVRAASVGRCGLLRFLLALQRGRHLRLPCFEVYAVDAFRLERHDEQSIVTVDGERVDFAGPLQACVSPLSASVMTAHA